MVGTTRRPQTPPAPRGRPRPRRGGGREDHGPVTTLRIVPHLRSSVVEEMPPGQRLLFTSRRGDAEADLLADPAVRPFSWSRLVDAARDPDLELLEVAEPLWLAEWVRALRYVVLVRVLRALTPGHRRVLIATYALENLDARERLGPGAVATRLRTLGVGLSMLLLDVVVFGTTGASENYRRAFGWALRRTRHAVLPPRLDACTVCGPGAVATAARTPTVLFLGTPSERKGFPVLVEAWARSGAAERGWRLVVADPTGEDRRDLPPGVTITTPTRPEVHELLRTGAVVAMPSVRRPGWREQIGLPLVEGLAHGCRVVTTTETGLAEDLREHPLVVLTVPGDAQDLADGLLRATAARSVPEAAGRAGYTKRDVVGWWLGRRPATTSARGRLPAGEPAAQPGPGAGRPQGPDDEHRLAEQPQAARQVGVEPEGAALLDELGDVAGEDGHEEGGHHQPDRHAVAGEQDQREPEGDLDHAGDEHHQVGVDRHPRGHLRPELPAGGPQVGGAGEQQEQAQEHAGDETQHVVQGAGPARGPAFRRRHPRGSSGA